MVHLGPSVMRVVSMLVALTMLVALMMLLLMVVLFRAGLTWTARTGKDQTRKML